MQESDEKIRRLLQGAAVDQAQTGAEHLASFASILYNGFTAGGLPSHVAATMTRDWFHLQMTRAIFGPGASPPIPPGWDGAE